MNNNDERDYVEESANAALLKEQEQELDPNNPLGLKVGDKVRPKVPPPPLEAEVIRFKMDGTPIVVWNTNPTPVLLSFPDEVEKVD